MPRGGRRNGARELDFYQVFKFKIPRKCWGFFKSEIKKSSQSEQTPGTNRARGFERD